MNTLSKLVLASTCAFASIAVQAAPPLNSIVANWHMDEGRGQRVLDLSGYGKNGQLGATAAVEASDPLWISRRFDNAALSFDGSQFIKVPHANHLQPQRISVEAWVKPGLAPATSLPVIVAKGAKGCSFATYALYMYNSEFAIDPELPPGTPYFYVAFADGSEEGTYIESPAGAPNLLDGNWHHLVGTYDRKAVRLYVDGVEVGTGTPHKAPIPYADFSNKDLYIGDYDGDTKICENSNGSYVGEMDEVRIWNKALTAAEVNERYLGH